MKKKKYRVATICSATLLRFLARVTRPTTRASILRT